MMSSPPKTTYSFRFALLRFLSLTWSSFSQNLETNMSHLSYVPLNEATHFDYIGVPSTNNIGFDTFQEVIMTRNKNRLVTCPGMVGPVDGKFYCHGMENGYCDRRSGTCFCNKGYAGVSCDICDPYHFFEGGLCYEKKSCPNACSSGGSCNVKTGRCTCYEGRIGEDCSQTLCTVFHKYCNRCNKSRCLDCVEGWTAIENNPLGSQCISCSNLYDPRCSRCNATSCSECRDLLLLSIHRSGPRDYDPELPFDETAREFGISIPFGSQQTNAFDEAEDYFIAPSELTPLNSFAVSCDQGLSGDSSFYCKFINISNVLCGNPGKIAFTRSHYEARERDGFLRIQIKRSGGGIGNVNVSYGIEHITTDDSDISPTTYYTDSQELRFSVHEIEKSFLITVHDDVLSEGNESFAVYLYNPTYPAELGWQSKATVTIIDDDDKKNQLPNSSLDTVSMEYDESKLFLQLYPRYRHEEDSEDIYVYFSPQNFFQDDSSARRKGIRDGNAMIWRMDDFDPAINYMAHMVRLKQNGLVGRYFDDDPHFGNGPFMTRSDRVINFTAFETRVKYVRWEGYLKTSRSGLNFFFVQAKKSRLWIDGILIIDEWIVIDGSSSGTISSGSYRVNVNELYAITLEVEVAEKEATKLFWAFKNTSMKVIDPKNFYFQASSTEFDTRAFSTRSRQ